MLVQERQLMVGSCAMIVQDAELTFRTRHSLLATVGRTAPRAFVKVGRVPCVLVLIFESP